MLHFNYEKNYKGVKYTFRQINKTVARKAYNNGLSVIFCPSNLNPANNFYNLEMIMNKNQRNCENTDFNKLLLYYEIYNCTCNETGKYTRFYIPVTNKINSYQDYESGKIRNYDYSFMNQN